MYGGFWKSIISVHRHMDLALGLSYVHFPRLNTRRYSPDEGAGAAFMEYYFGEEGYGRISGGTRVLERAADSWKAALGHGAR
jgi:hypothetical protein